MAGLSDKEAAFLAAARAGLARKSAEEDTPAVCPAAANAGASARPAVAAPSPIASPQAAPVGVDPLEKIAALMEAEREARAAGRERQRLIYLAIPAAIALLAAIWIFIRLLLKS